ncbi:MAG: flagellar hook-length control protein FliK [Thermodesulfovibrio sp.]|nr:flagellar hook-length control protein FliK [Thermodesulfovibrio sp.]MDW7998755.1 flagellar hook-length control protein FliK [Thermodesulfovibrio sp.]
MILIGNINLNTLNKVNGQLDILGQAAEKESFFNELQRLMLKNAESSQDILFDNSIFNLPLGYQNIFLIQNIKDYFSSSEELSSALKSLLEMGKIDIKELNSLLNNLNMDSKNLGKALFEKLLSGDNSQVKDVIDIIKSKETQEGQGLEVFKLKIDTESSKQNQLLFIDSVNENLSEAQKINPNSMEIKNSIIKKENLLSQQISLFKFEQSFSNDNIKGNEHIVELPFTQLKEVSDIVFKALSSSQKTIVVQLEPPDLGKILIKLSMDNTGVRADLKVDYPHVKEILSGLIPEIKNSLQSSGIKVSDFLLDLARDHRGYSDSYYGQGQRKYKGNQKFFEYFV